MVEAEHGRPPLPGLLTWSLGAFHTALFVAVLVALAYRSGGLGNLLGGLSTELGFAIYGALWLSVWWCTRRALHGGSVFWTSGRQGFGQAIRYAPYWGAATGGLFIGILVAGVFVALNTAPWLVLPVLLIVLIFPARLSGEGRRRVGGLVDGIAFGVGIVLLGIPLLIGAAVGLALALIDGLLLQAALHLFQITVAEPAADGPRASAISDDP